MADARRRDDLAGGVAERPERAGMVPAVMVLRGRQQERVEVDMPVRPIVETVELLDDLETELTRGSVRGRRLFGKLRQFETSSR
jgi:ribosomal protein L25 (general stress protein Ctc)